MIDDDATGKYFHVGRDLLSWTSLQQLISSTLENHNLKNHLKLSSEKARLIR